MKMPVVKQKLNTPTMQAHKAAAEAYSKAKDANEKKDDATTQKALEAARTKFKEATAALNTERFKRVASKRLNKAVKAIRFMGDTFNPRTYTFTKEQGELALKHMKDELRSAEDKFNRAMNGGGGASKEAAIEL